MALEYTQYDHFITKSIRRVYGRRLIMPLVFFGVLLLLFLLFPISGLLSPKAVTTYKEATATYQEGNPYLTLTLEDVYFTGYTNSKWGSVNGYYYYTLLDDRCIILLLRGTTCQQGISYLESITVSVALLEDSQGFSLLLSALSEDLSWTTEGIAEKVSPYLFSEPAISSVYVVLFFLVLIVTAAYALFALLVSTVSLLFPQLSPPCRQLGRFGKVRDLLEQAETELATLPQLATEDMFITEHFFIEIADFGIAVVPISQIVWIYKHSTLHKLLWYHFHISYTMYITTSKRQCIPCPKNRKSDIDGIMDYLAEANHNILVGFNEENRKKVQQLQYPKFSLKGLLQFLERRF